MLPADPDMLASFLNMKLRDHYASLDILCDDMELDKEEIVRISRKIGTFDTSILPYEDCCTVFTPRHPKTKPHLDEVREVEGALDVEALCAKAMENREFIRIKP